MAVLGEYFAAIRSAEEQKASWWAEVAPNVPFSMAAPLAGATITAYVAALDVEFTVRGTQLVTASLSAHVFVSVGSASTREYAVHASVGVRGRSLMITGWVMTTI